MSTYNERVGQIADVLRSHWPDDQLPGDQCLCRGVMGDVEEHQAMALIEAGLVSVNEEVK
jgi:hypothetical protein